MSPWALPVEPYDLPSVSPDGARVHVVTEDGALRAWTVATGELAWTAEAPKGGGRWGREEAYADGVLAMLVDGDGRARTVCRVGPGGKVRWCTALDRPVVDVLVGAAGTGLWVETDTHDARWLDPETGAPSAWVRGGTLHIYPLDHGPHDIRYTSRVAVVGVFDRVVVVADAEQGALVGWSGGAQRWSLPVEDLDRAWAGPHVEVFEGGVLRVGGSLGRIAEGGVLGWSRAVHGVTLTTPHGPAQVAGGEVVALTPDGEERWRAVADGRVAFAPQGPYRGDLAPGEPGDDVVWLDPATGAVTGRTPGAGLGDPSWVVADGLFARVAGDGAPRFASVDRSGAERWSRAGALELQRVLVTDFGTLERLDPVTGAVVGRWPAYPVASAGGAHVGRADDGRWWVWSGP